MSDTEDGGRFVEYEDEPEFVAGFEKTGPYVSGKFEAKGYDVTRTLEEAALIKIATEFSKKEFESLSKHKKAIEAWILDNLPARVAIDHINPTASILTAFWYIKREDLSKTNFEKFYKTYKNTGINKIDLLRYIRLFAPIKKKT